MKSWLSKLIAMARRGYAASRALPADDRRKLQDNAKKLTKRVLKK